MLEKNCGIVSPVTFINIEYSLDLGLFINVIG